MYVSTKTHKVLIDILLILSRICLTELTTKSMYTTHTVQMKSEGGEGENVTWPVKPGVNLKFLSELSRNQDKKRNTQLLAIRKGNKSSFFKRD